MSGVKRYKVIVPHPDSDKLGVITTKIEVDLSDNSAEALEAISTILDNAAYGGEKKIAAFNKAVRAKSAEYLERAISLRDGQRKKRGSRMPRLDKWIDEKLATDSDASNDDLWNELPEDDALSEMYREGETVCEIVNNATRGITRPAFDKRVTSARKRRKNDISK